MPSLDVAACRKQFPALKRKIGKAAAIYFDGPGGTQVPQRVVEAVQRYLVENNANVHGKFATSRETDAMLDSARLAAADFLGTDDPDTVVFGPNMTTLTFALSRSVSRSWQRGDEIIVTRLDHDANVSPWIMAAQDRGVKIHEIAIHADDCTLDMDDLRSKLSGQTRLVAVGCASNATGTINPVRRIISLAHAVGAEVFLDAVHFAPHAAIDVTAWECDYLVFSSYKVFGPHVGILWGRRKWLEELEAYRVRPAGESLPGKWMTGTQNHEGIAGVLASIEYLADVGWNSAPQVSLRRDSLLAAFQAIGKHERTLVERLLAGLKQLKRIKVWGITDPARFEERAPTVAITHQRISPADLAAHLAARGIFLWHGNFYAQSLSQDLGLEPDGMLRIGLVHYNTTEEIDRLLAELGRLE